MVLGKKVCKSRKKYILPFMDIVIFERTIPVVIGEKRKIASMYTSFQIWRG
jgi:hypothetical protein